MKDGDHSGAVVTHSPPTSEVGGSNPGTHVGGCLLMVAVYNTEP